MSKSLTKKLFTFAATAIILGSVFGFSEETVDSKTASAFIDKKINKSGTSDYYDNLTGSDAFKPGEVITYKIFVRNTGDVDIVNIRVKDIFSKYVNYHSAPSGGDYKDGVWEINIGTLRPSDTKTLLIRGQVVGDKDLPSDKSLICDLKNRAEMHGDVSGGLLVADEAEFCIEHGVITTTAVTTYDKGGPVADYLPEAGAGSVILISSLLSGAGLAFRKFAK